MNQNQEIYLAIYQAYRPSALASSIELGKYSYEFIPGKNTEEAKSNFEKIKPSLIKKLDKLHPDFPEKIICLEGLKKVEVHDFFK